MLALISKSFERTNRGAIALGDRAFAPIDWVRSRMLLALGRLVPSVLSDRALRIRWTLSLSIVVSFVLVLLFPLLVFAISPLVLGIPHLVSDVRYLVVRPQLHRDPRMLLVLAGLAAVYVWPTPQVGLGAAFMAALLARGPFAIRGALLAFVGALMVWAERDVWAAGLGLTHLHNVAALAIGFGMFLPSLRAATLPTLLYAAGSAAILAGATDGVLLRPEALAAGWTDVGLLVTQYAPETVTPIVALRLLVWFVFSQSVHYAVWLRSIPDAARDRPGIRGYRSSFRALVKDLGVLPLLIASGMMVFLLSIALRDPEGARVHYLQIAMFHAYLEFAVIALFLSEREVRTRIRGASTPL